MTICFSNKVEIIDFLIRGGYVVLNLEDIEQGIEGGPGDLVNYLLDELQTEHNHWLIMSSRGDYHIGCTTSRIDVLMEEPDVTFKEVDPANCPNCKEVE